MKNLAKRFLSDDDRRKVEAAVNEVEKKTSGEIVPMVVSASYHYPMADVIGAVAFSLPVAILLTYLIGRGLWIGGQNLWLFLGIFTVLFAAFHALVKQWPGLKRLFISGREMDEEVEEAAVTAFFREGLHRTRDETGVLVFISVFERRVWVLADRGINAEVAEDQWDEAVRLIVAGIKQRRQTEAICEAVTLIGEILCRHFPVKPDDTNELRNLIVDQ
jgi:putative membrane protein